MKLCIVAVGQKMPDWAQTAYDDYAARLDGTNFELNTKLVKAEPRTSGKTVAALMQAEAERISAAIPARSRVIALDERGAALTTVQMAEQLQAAADDAQSITWLIGGADGLAPELKASAAAQWRLSAMTLPHAMARVLLVEQIYRAWSVLNNHPYHRA